jgi:hypothetical protein
VNKKHTDTPTETHAHPEPAPQPPSILQPIMDDLKARTPTQVPQTDEIAPPRGPLHPPQPAELDQDPGGGYNPDGTYPQT